MYNLIEYSSNYSETTENLKFYWKWFYYEATDFNNNIANSDDLKPLKCKDKLLGNTEAWTNPNDANAILKMQQLLCH